VDIDASEIGRNYPVELGIIADARAFLGQMLEMAKAKGLKRDGKAWTKEVYDYKTEWRNFIEPYKTNDEVPIDPRRIILDMRRLSPDDTIMVVDVGNNQAWAEQYWGTPQPKTHISPGGSLPWVSGSAGFWVPNWPVPTPLASTFAATAVF